LKVTIFLKDADEITVGYPSMFELMHDLKGKHEKGLTFHQVPVIVFYIQRLE
jgi:hypothetical protein